MNMKSSSNAQKMTFRNEKSSRSPKLSSSLITIQAHEDKASTAVSHETYSWVQHKKKKLLECENYLMQIFLATPSNSCEVLENGIFMWIYELLVVAINKFHDKLRADLYVFHPYFEDGLRMMDCKVYECQELLLKGKDTERRNNLDVHNNLDVRNNHNAIKSFKECNSLSNNKLICMTEPYCDVKTIIFYNTSVGKCYSYSISYGSMAQILVVLLFMMLQITCIVGMVPQDEIFALESFYNSTNGDDWLWKNEDDFGLRWNFTSDVINPCDMNGKVWQGIQCSRAASLCGGTQICHVTSIDLKQYDLRGIIPPEMENLISLKYLCLSSNKLSGTIPITFGNLLSLQSLYLNLNSLNGTIPPELGNLVTLQYLDFERNSMIGTIPSELGKLSNLQSLFLGSNSFNGIIPPELESLVYLEKLYLDSNGFNGTIPPELGNLVSLQYLNMYRNALSGTIPIELCHVVSLRSLNLVNNTFSGTIPPEIGNLVYLKYLSLDFNALSGTIPPELGNLISALYLNLGYNLLSGTIPAELENLLYLKYLCFDFNALNGTIPPEFKNLISLKYFYAHNNALRGNIPPELGNLVSLEYLILNFNALSGTIPSELCNLKSLLNLFLDHNALSGTIPSELMNLSALQYLILSYNAVRGTIPSELGNVVVLQYLDLSYNPLSGTIPSELMNLSALQYLILSYNAVSGTIPSELGKLSSLGYLNLNFNKLGGLIPLEIETLNSLYHLDLSNNNFMGSIAASIGKLTNLQQLFLQNNQLTGSMSKWFENRQYCNMRIVHIDVSNNRFSGSLSVDMFLLPNLQTIALTKNCFTGTLPSSMCDATKVSVFSMDGMGIAEDCKYTISLPLTNVLLGNTLQGTIPPCVMLLGNMTVLSLAANGLTGTLSELGELSLLVNLSVSNNYISGTIPSSIASHHFQLLDLSYNKIHGYLDYYNNGSYSAGNDSSLILAVNRLSGGLTDLSAIPFHTLDILGGNIFGCRSLVSNDVNSDTYVCGSEEFNKSLISLCAFFGVLGLIVIWLLYYFHRNNDKNIIIKNITCILQYYKVACALDESRYSRLKSLVKCFNHWSFSMWMICVSIIVFTAPIYILKFRDYGKSNPTYATHSKVYAWEMTTAYITGEVPAGLLLLSWFVCVCIFVLLMTMVVFDTKTNNSFGERIQNTNTNKLSYEEYIKFFIMLLIDICVVGAMNALYVYLILQEFDISIHTLIQICFAFLKFVWNFFVVPSIIFTPLPVSPYRSWWKLFLNMLNSVFLPCIASLFTSTSCFQGVFITPSEITSSYQYSACVDTIALGVFDETRCKEYSNLSVDVVPIVPPFAYSNLCGSVILTSYIPVYIYMYIISILINVISTYVCCAHVNYSKHSKRIQNMLNRGVMWPQHDWCSNNGEKALSRRLLEVDEIICNILHHTGILLTFGLCCPILAMIIAGYVSIYVLVLLVVFGRFVTLIDNGQSNNNNNNINNNNNHYKIVVEALELASSNIDENIDICLWEVVWMTCIFYAVLCWDMASDRTYWKNAIWIPMTALTMPLAMWLCYCLFMKYFINNNHTKKQNFNVDVNFYVDVDVENRLYNYDHAAHHGQSELLHVESNPLRSVSDDMQLIVIDNNNNSNNNNSDLEL